MPNAPPSSWSSNIPKKDPYAAAAATATDAAADHRPSGTLQGVACAQETSLLSTDPDLVQPPSVKVFASIHACVASLQDVDSSLEVTYVTRANERDLAPSTSPIWASNAKWLATASTVG